MAILTGIMHCPCCGGTDPSDWRESAGTPTWCLDDTAEITEECDENCQHLEDDELNAALAMLGPAPSPVTEPRKWLYPVGGQWDHPEGGARESPTAKELFTDASPFRPAPAWLATSHHPWLTGHGI